MSKENKIQVVTYEEERLNFFTELMQLARTRYNLIYRQYKDCPYLSEEHQVLSDMGREIQFFGDVVEMLEKGYRKQSVGVWMTHHCTNGGTSQRGRTIIYKTFTCDRCGKSNGRHKTNYCPNCGAKMKGD